MPDPKRVSNRNMNSPLSPSEFDTFKKERKKSLAKKFKKTVRKNIRDKDKEISKVPKKKVRRPKMNKPHKNPKYPKVKLY